MIINKESEAVSLVPKIVEQTKLTSSSHPVIKQDTHSTTQVTNKTASWQIYSNTKLWFELKYPTDWRVVEIVETNERGAAFGPQSIQEDTLFRITIVSKIPTLGIYENNYEITKIEGIFFKD